MRWLMGLIHEVLISGLMGLIHEVLISGLVD